MEIEVILEKEDEGGFSVYVPSLPGCVSQGENREDAIENIKEAIELYLEADSNELIVYKGKGESVKIKI
jgi:predicted RNase H-like HicB family nuclease